MPVPLIPQLPIPPVDLPLFARINAYIHTYMSQYDNSHDYQHILRVLSNANLILQHESIAHPDTQYNTTHLFLAALLHDVGDHKYAKPGESAPSQIATVLHASGASEATTTAVQTIAANVSYTHETRDPEAVRAALLRYPELAVVQDADRLDAIGTVGIARCFSFGAAKFPEQEMGRAVAHFGEKLYRLEGLMKTQAGREMARKRTQVVRDFEREWNGEVELSFALE